MALMDVVPDRIPDDAKRNPDQSLACPNAFDLLYPKGYKRKMEIRQTERFARWFADLRDGQARRRIQARIDRLQTGNLGDVRPVGAGVSELRIDYGPGYRVYFVQRGRMLIVLLAGGDKRTQQKDITAALEMARRV